MRLLVSAFLSIYALNTSLKLYGPGTCSFDGAAGGRIVYIERFYDNSGAISCNLAASLIAIVVIAYWIYIYSEFKSIKATENSSFQKVQRTEYFENKENFNSEVYELEKKLEELNEEEKLKELRDQLNKKRLERNLISLDEFEQLEENIINLRLKFKNSKNLYQSHVEKISKIYSDKYIYSIGLIFFAGLLLNWSVSSSDLIRISLGLVLFTIFLLLGIWNFRYRNELLIKAKELLENLEIEKNENLTNLKKAKKYLKDNIL